MTIDALYHKKQQEVMSWAFNNDYFMLINSGAKRTGKTILNNDLFLYELRRVRKIADRLGIAKPQYILAGADLGAIQRNVLTELTNKYDLDFKFDKYNRFMLFGVRVCCFGHSKINDLNRIRGLTAFGAYVNEASLANEEVFDEIKSRCSGEGARILCDTNPSHPSHWLKVNYMDKSDGKTIQAFHYRLDDNTFLSERYRESMKKSTSGLFYERNIEGRWCMAEGVVYPDFNADVHYISKEKLKTIQMKHYMAGVDFGWEHYGSICVVGVGVDNNYYVVKEIAQKHRHIEWWIEQAKEIIKEYGDIFFYCDYARMDYITKMQQHGIKAIKANKAVMEGIATVASLFKQNRLYVVKDNVKLFDHEIYNYVWKPNADEPIKADDDFLDN